MNSRYNLGMAMRDYNPSTRKAGLLVGSQPDLYSKFKVSYLKPCLKQIRADHVTQC